VTANGRTSGGAGPVSGLSVVVTRPQRDAQTWVAALAQAGHQPLCLPLMAFDPAPDPSALEACLAEWRTFSVWVFVSPQAVHAFWEKFLEKNTDLPLVGRGFVASVFGDFSGAKNTPLRCWAPGPGTARALQAVGVPAHCIDQPAADAPQFDSEALWAVVQTAVQPGDRVLLVRGTSHHRADTPGGVGRDWLEAQCVASGASVTHCVAYTRAAPVWSGSERAQALAASGAGQVWLLTSSESVGHLSVLLPGRDWSGTQALATHPRIACAAQALGFGRVWHSRPALGDVLNTLDEVRGRTTPHAEPPKMPVSP
jgi:uroporphyrinogen-III synthase